ncbi:MAG: TVP38/TMEM64 family protein [Desulfobacterales bacterium]|nr:TVP38/TMEM64 family protein [Desulfobacterales bacterium]
MATSFWTKWKWVLLLCILAGVVFFIIYRYNSELWDQVHRLYHIYQDHHQLKKVIKSFGPYAPLAYILLQIIQVVIAPIPGGAIEFLGGYLFGVKAGFVYSIIGLTLGSWLAFSLARIFEKIAVEKFVSEKTRKKFDYLVEHEGVILSFIFFLLPGFPKDALCYILGLTPMHLGIFLIISTLGRIPGTLIAILQGAKAFEHEYYTFGMLLGGSALVILVFFIYHEEIHNLIKKLKEGKKEEF